MSRPADILLRQGDTTPQWPTAGQISFYSKSNGVFYSLDSNGVETPFGGAAGTGTVTSVSVIANPSRLTATGNPITTSGSITLDLAETTVVAGAYTNANITVDAYGRITAASNGSAVAGVSSFNTRTGDITLNSGDVTGALGFTPYDATNPAGYTSNTGTVTSVSGTGTVSGLTLTGSVSTTGNLTLGGTLALSSGDITGALGFTPYNASNPAGYINGITSTNVVNALGFTPYNATNPAGYISGITGSDVTTALGFTPGVGTVTSVGSVGDNGVTVSGSPITGAGTITIGLGDITPLSVLATGSVTGLNLSGTNTGDQTITLTGEVTGSGTGSFATALSATGVTANTYGSATEVPVFTVDAKGRITSVTNTAISVGGSGTVTSVTVSGGSTGLSFGGTPITTSGTATMAGTLLIANGGTGQTTAAAAANALLPSQTGKAGQYLTTDGTTLSWSTVTSGGTGTVTSVSATGANGIVVAGSPITASGTLAFSLGDITPTSVAATGTVTGTNLSGTNTGDQTITLTGDVTGTGTGSFAVTLANVNLTPQIDSFRKITVNSKGLVTATSAITTGDITTALGFTPYNSTNPAAYASGTVTSVAGTGSVSGITLSGSFSTSGTLSLGGTLSLTNAQVVAGLGYTPYSTANPAGYATGTVTSINNSGGSTGLTFTGGPVTTTGTLTLGGTLAIGAGGTGKSTASEAINALLPSQTGNAGFMLTTDGTVASWSSSGGSGTVSSVSGTGTVNGLTLSGTVTSTGSLTLGGTLSLTNSEVVNGLGYTPYSATNPSGYASGTVTSVIVNGTTGRIESSGSPITTSGAITLDLVPTAVTAGAYTLASITVDAYGRITAATNGTSGAGTVTSVGVTSTASRITVSGSPVTTSGAIAIDLATTTVAAGAYGSSSVVPVITVDAYGRVTNVTNTSITAPASPSETVIFKYDTGSGGAMTGADAIYSSTSGVTATVTSGAACTCTFTFTGKSAPPKTVTTYSQNTSSNNFVTKDITAYISNTIVGGGTVAVPSILTGFTSANVMTLTLTQAATGAVGGIGLRAFLMVTFGF